MEHPRGVAVSAGGWRRRRHIRGKATFRTARHAFAAFALLTVDVAQPAEPVRHQLQRHEQIGVGNHPRNDQNANLCLGVARHISGHKWSPSAHPMPQGGAPAAAALTMAAGQAAVRSKPRRHRP